MAHTVGIQHVQITIAPGQEASSREFYLDLLGLQEMPDPFRAKGGFWALAGEQEVHVRVEADVDRAATRAHTAFLVDALAPLQAELASRGVGIEPQPKVIGFDRIHLLDPSGNRIELMQRDNPQSDATRSTPAIAVRGVAR